MFTKTILLAYKYRLYPNKKQKINFAQHFGCVRMIYNYFLNKQKQAYQTTKAPWNRFFYQAQIPELKKQLPYLKNVNSQSLQFSVQNLDKAYKNFFRHQMGEPCFKLKHHEQSFCVPQNVKVDFQKKQIFIPKLQTGINCKIHRIFNGEIKQATVIKTKTEKYYISIVVEQPDIAECLRVKLNEMPAIGIDVGLLSFLTLSDGTKVDNPHWFKESEEKLARLQRKLSKRVKCSNNRNKQRIKVAKQHQKVANQRKDFQHKLSRKIVDDNQVNMILVENLNIRGMLMNHKLAKHISSVAWGQFLRFLEYKTLRAGKHFSKIGRFEPTSKMCHVCGHINDSLNLSDRTWQCPHCLSMLDRDINAAINIRDIGLGLYTAGIAGINTCGEGTATVEPANLRQVSLLKQEASQ